MIELLVTNITWFSTLTCAKVVDGKSGGRSNAVDLRKFHPSRHRRDRHPGEGRGPEKIKKTWIPAFAGMTVRAATCG
jgi:hypothetical protein